MQPSHSMSQGLSGYVFMDYCFDKMIKNYIINLFFYDRVTS